MPQSKEFALQLEDKPGTLGKCCDALAKRGVNIVAFEAFVHGGKGECHMVVDNPANAKTVFDNEGLHYNEKDVVVAKLPNRAGELGRAASRLGDSNINIQYTYCGFEAGTNTPLVVFGVADVKRASGILDELVTKAA